MFMNTSEGNCVFFYFSNNVAKICSCMGRKFQGTYKFCLGHLQLV